MKWLIVLVALSGALARAEGPYLRHFDSVALLPAPPAVGSAEDKADRDSAYEVYAHRTPEDAARAKAEHDFNVFVFAPQVGPSFDAAHCPHLAALCDAMIKEARVQIDRAKQTWNRPRPYVLEPVRFSHPADSEKSAGYPSGHSTRGTLMALVLCEIFPQDHDALIAKSRLIGWTRVEAGVHTPLDIYGGRVLGQALAHAFLANPAFRADLDAAKAEASAAAR